MLRNVDLTTSGKFRCEVSGEAPLFQTATHTNVLIVVGQYKMSSRFPFHKILKTKTLAMDMYVYAIDILNQNEWWG